jgi:Fur family transcriptional regulator, peroxide stress response regulator
MKSVNLKETRQRKYILEQVRKLSSHPTAEDLYFAINKKFPAVSKATLYRNLDNFCKKGLIKRIEGKYQRFDGNVKPHNHIKCVYCGRVDDIFFDIEINSKKLKKLGYKIEDFAVAINGICPKCAKNKVK